MTDQATKVNELPGVGKATGLRLKKLGIETAGDLIFYYPFRYDDFGRVIKINQLSVGQLATVRGKLELIASRRTRRKRKTITEALVSDESGSLRVIWFNQPWLAKTLKPGEELVLSGKTAGDLFNIYLNSPSYEKPTSVTGLGGLVPIYSIVDGLSQKQLRSAIRLALGEVQDIDDFLPEEIRQKEKLISLKSALGQIHFPKNRERLTAARERLAFDELFLLQLWSQITKKQLAQKESWPLSFRKNRTKKFLGNFGFTLTPEQKKAAWEIIKDLEKNRPMNRLLEGDVGSGKTAVAALAMLQATANGCQAVLMAPTEILARQHFKTLGRWFESEGTVIGLLTRAVKMINSDRVDKKEFLAACKTGKIDIVVGTHSAIQAEVTFKKMALAVIDEQHRFGVEQRQALKEKSKKIPHFLSLTATPIPRSLALIVYGELDISIIKSKPPGRRPVISRVVPPEKRRLAYEFIAKKIAAGRQVFVICPLIDPSDKLGVRSVTEEFKKLDQEIFPDLPVGLLHGRLKTEEKEKIMSEFVDNKIKILVSTSVIEVGVDVPNATIMMIEGAERFGLAQLHQFRGRVGRNQEQAYCFLFSESVDGEALARLEFLAGCNDGFALAQKDLELRGAGQIYGYQQSGLNDLKIARIDDLELIKRAKMAAEQLVEKDVNLVGYESLRKKLDSLAFSDHLE